MSLRYSNEAEDKWFRWKGATPPERNAHLTEEEIRKLLEGNLEGHTCIWKQEGSMIYCDSGEFEHGKHIGPKVRLDGQDGNIPKLSPMGPILRDSAKTA